MMRPPVPQDMALTQPSVSAQLENCISRVEECENTVQAWEHLDLIRARQRAAEIDRNAEPLPLRGLVVAVKDIFDTEDMPTEYGSPIHSGRRPSIDAAAVTLLRAEGAVVLGKTVTTEFACSRPSRTRNPHDPAFSPGGSSSGSAAAVAAGMVDVALGSQTLGSVIRPASFCGVVGFKPSFGRISRAGVFSLAPSLDTMGVLGKNVESVRRVYSVLSGDVRGGTDSSSTPRRFAVAGGSFFSKASTDAKAAIANYGSELRNRGYELEEVEFGEEFEAIGRAARIVHDFEVGQRFISEARSRKEDLSEHIHAILDRASKIPIGDYEDAVAFGESQRAKYSALLARYRGLLTLAALGEAPLANASTGDPAFSTPWTFLHVPCISLPLLRGRNGLPIGVQIVAPRFADHAALEIAANLESLGSVQA